MNHELSSWSNNCVIAVSSAEVVLEVKSSTGSADAPGMNPVKYRLCGKSKIAENVRFEMRGDEITPASTESVRTVVRPKRACPHTCQHQRRVHGSAMI